MTFSIDINGGWIGKMSTRGNVNELPPELQNAMRSIFQSQPEYVPLADNQLLAMDETSYSLRVEEEGKAVELKFSDGTIPQRVKPLIKNLADRARAQRFGG
ncbi:protealysin inhibitor emfourin [Mucilaginibacter paludis]|uniref:Uncharacterized protein n=1 Tax=Mucilaginibacter paludis DSM 18603 TaxID=714943 RepID=H1YA16_9SPHI|nr:protealysin inhibitor emfourin [Mucilaginibacter paludis]EHQ25000.1 hypothetical protein Mucpa_0819 [Mucilaginibacter paludis DSM 18603]